MKLLNYIIATASLLILLAGCSTNQPDSNISKIEEAIPVKLEALSKSKSSNNILISGSFTTNDETLLSFKTGGVVSAVYVQDGDKVSKGQLLASLDITEISAAVQQAQLAVEKSNRDFQRAKNLFNDSVASLEQLQNAETAHEMAVRQLTSAQFNLTFSQIRANSDGVILKKLVNPGQIVGAGMPIIQTSSKGKSDWVLKAAVSDKQWSEILIGDSVSITADVLDGLKCKGVVSSKSENADPFTGSFSVEIKVIDGKKLNLASGMFGKAEVHASKSKSGWIIPYEAILDGNGANGFVFATNDKKIAVKVPVTISSLNNNTAFISSGLESYQYLITSGNAYLTNQSAISVK